MPWDDLPAQQIDVEAIPNPEPAPVHLYAPALPHTDDVLDDSRELEDGQVCSIEMRCFCAYARRVATCDRD